MTQDSAEVNKPSIIYSKFCMLQNERKTIGVRGHKVKVQNSKLGVIENSAYIICR